jgi:protochlorophyllide reductase
MACRGLAKAAAAAERLSIPSEQVTLIGVAMGSQASVHRFVETFRESTLPVHALICNAAVYLPRLKEPERSPEGYEISLATNYFGHFLLSHLLLPDLQRSVERTPRLITLGTVTANFAEFAGKIPIPAPADLGQLQGLRPDSRRRSEAVNARAVCPLLNRSRRRRRKPRWEAACGT